MNLHDRIQQAGAGMKMLEPHANKVFGEAAAQSARTGVATMNVLQKSRKFLVKGASFSTPHNARLVAGGLRGRLANLRRLLSNPPACSGLRPGRRESQSCM